MVWPHHMAGFGLGGWIICGLLILLLAGGVIAVTLLAIRATKGIDGDGRSAQRSSAVEILKKRYARGEIGKAEFEEIRRDLET